MRVDWDLRHLSLIMLYITLTDTSSMQELIMQECNKN